MEDNVSDAMSMAFGILVFVMALSSVMFLFQTLWRSGNNILKHTYTSTSGYFANIDFWDPDKDKINTNLDYDSREVTKGSIIPILYRYYKENFAVKIYDKNGQLRQVFDLGLEGEASRINSLTSSKQSTLTDYERSVIKEQFSKENNELFLFTAPWRGAGLKSEKDTFTKNRIDLYVNGKKGYINGIEVDYSKNNRNWFKNLPDDTKFKEYVVRYQMKGDVKTGDYNDFADNVVLQSAPIDRVEVIFVQE